MTTTVTRTAPEVTVWQSRDDLIPADMAALRLAASGHVTDPRDVADLTEELETRLAGVLYVTGQAFYRTGVRDLLGHADTATTERYTHRLKTHDQRTRTVVAKAQRHTAPRPARMPPGVVDFAAERIRRKTP